MAVAHSLLASEEKILDIFYEMTGICFLEKKEIVISKIKNFCECKNIAGFEQLISNIKSDSALSQELVNLLTVNETYFFRETRQIEILKQLVKAKNSPFRILNAPSSSGEESYTIVIALLEAGVPPSQIELVGIDINSEVIDTANKGTFSKRSLHRTEEAIKSRYFIEEEKFFRLKEDIRKYAKFQTINIFDPAISRLGKFDYLFSRNMLIYFDKESKRKVEKIFYNLLKDGGYMFLGHADIIENSFNLKKSLIDGVGYYQKL